MGLVELAGLLLLSRGLEQLLMELLAELEVGVLILVVLHLVALRVLLHVVVVRHVRGAVRVVVGLLVHVDHAVVLLLLGKQLRVVHGLEVLLVVSHLGCGIHQVGIVEEEHLLVQIGVLRLHLGHVLVASHAVQLAHLSD